MQTAQLADAHLQKFWRTLGHVKLMNMRQHTAVTRFHWSALCHVTAVMSRQQNPQVRVGCSYNWRRQVATECWIPLTGFEDTSSIDRRIASPIPTALCQHWRKNWLHIISFCSRGKKNPTLTCLYVFKPITSQGCSSRVLAKNMTCR